MRSRSQVQRKIMLRKILELLITESTIIFIDESSFNNEHKRFRTWVKPKQNYERHFPGRLPSLNIILATMPHEVLHYVIKSKTTNTNDFKSFLQEVVNKIENNEVLSNCKRSNKLWLFMDNASIHKTKVVRDFIRENKLNVIYSVPYRPEYNLAEKIFAFLKMKFYKSIMRFT